ncbi:hypothetical protein [Streptomyces tropicalis]|uniref:Uncharacterized protein n=1 Tax=Streptomyces tropicalis TaxID=3034234 RepID=A0ABT6A6H4_9ACTN|nr:hypothetical protein [Streptomyces tropicalis]MDF3300254.1 hypothetical protein [Streptomyces tropicalis]
MREKPLSRIENELLRLRRHLSSATEHPQVPAGFAVNRALVSGLVAGDLSEPQEAELAGEVARALPFHWSQFNTEAEVMSELTDHLGGRQELVSWLDRFPGAPRLVARLYVLMGLLDRFSEEAPVVTALREFREGTPYPAGLQGYLLPETDDGTLAELAFRIERLLGDGERERAVALALSTAECLERVAPRAAEIDPGAAGDLGELMEHSRKDIQEAVSETPA